MRYLTRAVCQRIREIGVVLDPEGTARGEFVWVFAPAARPTCTCPGIAGTFRMAFSPGRDSCTKNRVPIGQVDPKVPSFHAVQAGF